MKGDNLRSDVRSLSGIPRLHSDGYTSAITDRPVHGAHVCFKASYYSTVHVLEVQG